jgi:hypothetical protein
MPADRNEARGASSGGAPAGDPTPLERALGIAGFFASVIRSGEPWTVACAAANDELHQIRARLSVSPPPSGEERPALTREEMARIVGILRMVGAGRVLDTSQRMRVAEFASRLASSSSSSVPSATGETARLRAALTNYGRHLDDCPKWWLRDEPQECTCGFDAALSPTEQETR